MTSCFFANFIVFDKQSQNALILVSQIMVARPKSVTIVKVFQFTYNMRLFLSVRSISKRLPPFDTLIFYFFDIQDNKNRIFVRSFDDQDQIVVLPFAPTHVVLLKK